jgi:hypothetical protein
MASSKDGGLPFDPPQIDLPSISALVAFYHACLGFLVKDMWLDAIKVGNCDTFAGLTYSNVAHYCPVSDTSSADATKYPINQTTVNTPHQSAPNYQGPSAAGQCITRGVSPCLSNQQTMY